MKEIHLFGAMSEHWQVLTSFFNFKNWGCFCIFPLVFRFFIFYYGHSFADFDNGLLRPLDLVCFAICKQKLHYETKKTCIFYVLLWHVFQNPEKFDEVLAFYFILQLAVVYLLADVY